MGKLLDVFAPWSYVVLSLALTIMVGGAYTLGTIHASDRCVAATQEHDARVAEAARRLEAGKAAIREDSLRRIVIQMDTAYQQQAASGAKVVAELNTVRASLNAADQKLAEKVRHAKDIPDCDVDADTIRLLNEGIRIGPIEPPPTAPGLLTGGTADGGAPGARSPGGD